MINCLKKNQFVLILDPLLDKEVSFDTVDLFLFMSCNHHHFSLVFKIMKYIFLLTLWL